MPTINTIADYMVAVARLNLCTPTNILQTTHNDPESVIRLQAYKILASYGTPKEMKFAIAWLKRLEDEIKEADADTAKKTVVVQVEDSVALTQPAPEARVDTVV